MRVVVEFPEDPFALLDGLAKAVKSKYVRIAMNAAAAPVKAAVVAAAPKLSGAMKASVRIKVKSYRRNGVWTAIIGPTYAYKRKGPKRTRGPFKGTRPTVQPARYAYQVDQGTKHAGPHPFIRPALETSKAQFAATFTAKLKQLIESGPPAK